MVLQVDPHQLTGTAAQLAAMARETARGLPPDWVRPAGREPISATAVPQLNGQAAALFNDVIGVLDEIQRTAHKIGVSAVEYSKGDDEGSRIIGGPGGEVVTNPVPLPMPLPRRTPPPPAPDAGAPVDTLGFARGLRSGPGAEPAAGFADSLRTFAQHLATGAGPGLDSAARAMQHWTPTGAAASTELGKQRGRLDLLGTRLGSLADGIDGYANAFRTAKAKHPTPEEIQATRKKLLAAMRSKNEAAFQAALAEFQEQNARSMETVTGYTTEVGSKVTGGAGKDVSDRTDNGGGNGNGSGSGDSNNLLNSVLPGLMSAMQSAMPMAQQAMDPGYDDYAGYEDPYSYDDLSMPSSLSTSSGPGSPSSGIPSVDSGIPGTDPSVAVSAMPAVNAPGSPSSNNPGLPRTPVIDALSPSSTAANAARNGMPMMPYMPMAPGMGAPGGQGNERNRVVAWHPDRLMYVDDTPHTDPVIGERPTIAPTVTPPTPAPPNQNQSGGSA